MTLRKSADIADAARFVGREVELAMARDVLEGSTPSRILYLYGRGGIGKSTLLRAIDRLATREGLATMFLDGTDPSRAWETIERLPSSRAVPMVVFVDEADEFDAALSVLRDRLLDALDADDRIVLAGRTAPEPNWRDGGLDAILIDAEVGPLSDSDARKLLELHRSAGGVTPSLEPADVPGILEWAQGSPLALTVAALSPGGHTGRPVVEALEARLTTWITGQDTLEVATDIIDVAALAPVVDARLLAAVLPSRSTRGAMTQLVNLPVVRSRGDRAVLNEVLAHAIRSRLKTTAPERHRDLTRRIVEHLGSRARMGDIEALVEMSQFISDPDMRQAITNRPSRALFTDVATLDDVAAFGRKHGFADGPDWEEIRDFAMGAAPYRLVVRHVEGWVVLCGVFGRADHLVEIGPVTSSLVSAVTQTGVDPARSFVGVVGFADATDAVRAEAARLGAGGLMHLHGIADMQAVLIHYPPPDRRPLDALAAIAAPLSGKRAREVAISDFRPDGAAGFVEAVVLGELGFAARSGGGAALLVDDDDLARQDRLRERLDVVFDDSPGDRRLRQVIELAHLGSRPSEAECLEALHVSRRTWFRLLREARERVTDPNR